MREFALCKELTLKIFKDLGATPFSIGKTGLTHNDLLTNLRLKVSDEDGSAVRDVPVWYGEARGEDPDTMCCLLAGLDSDPDKLEVALVLGFRGFDGAFKVDGTRLSAHYDWANEEDPGTVVMKAGDKWLPISLAQRLQFALGFETMVQDGVQWQQSSNIPEELLKDLSEIIEVDEKNG